MKKKKTEEAKQFWELAEKTSKQVESWPPWKQQFASGTASGQGQPAMTHHPRPWWFGVALRWVPDRCREIPEATDATGQRIVLRQVAIIKRYLYLQQFASSENPAWAHSHQWRWVLAIGLWGSYREHRLGGHYTRLRRAPYLYWMGRDVIHRVGDPSPGHTSLFLGLWRDDDLKEYHRTGQGVPWDEHIRVMVKRI